MYDLPTKGDLDRNLSTIMHAAHDKAQAEKLRLTSEFAARGMASSTSLIVSVVAALDKIHAASIEEAMHVIRDFANRMNKATKEITPWARPQLENLANSVLEQIPAAGFPQEQQRLRYQYLQVFQSRLDGMLRDIEIGFIGGRSMPIKDSDHRATVLKKFYDARHSKRWLEIPVDTSASKKEQITIANICGQLSQNGLIEWKALAGEPVGMGRITSRGVDVIEGTAAPPIAITIDSRQISVHGSSNVQIGDSSTRNIIVTSAQTFSRDVYNLVQQVEQLLPASNLPSAVQSDTRAALDELKAATNEQPSPHDFCGTGWLLRPRVSGSRPASDIGHWGNSYLI